jgi:hypothetical protein
VSDDDGGPAIGGLELLRKEDFSVERRAAVDVEGGLPRRDARRQLVAPVARLRPALALHVRVGRLAMKIRSIAIDQVGCNLPAERRRRRECQRGDNRRPSGDRSA